MSDMKFPSCAYDVCAEFDCEETMALALIATRNELKRTRKALDAAVGALKWIHETYNLGMGYEAAIMEKCEFALGQITALEQKDVK